MSAMQAALLRALLARSNWTKYGEIVRPALVSEQSAKRLLSIISGVHSSVYGDISVGMLRMHVEADSLPGTSDAEEMLEAVQAVEEAEDLSVESLEPAIVRTVRREAVLSAITWAAAHINDEDLDVSRVKTMLDKAEVSLSGEDDDSLVDYASAAPPEDDARQGVSPLGLNHELDAALGGGVANGELLVILAPPNTGKTSHLWAATAAAAKQGKTVLGISLEINRVKCEQRLDSALTHMSRDELIANPVHVLDRRKRLSGRVWIRDWSSRKAKVSDIRDQFLELEVAGSRPDMIMVDYMELVHPEMFDVRNRRFNYGEVCVDLRRLANELQVPVITAWQTNRGGADKNVIGVTDVGEDWSIVKTADIIIGLNMNAAEQQHKRNRINILKQRESTARSVHMNFCDMDRMIFRKAEAGDLEAELGGIGDGGDESV